MNSDEQDIREVHAAWIGAVNAGDLDRLLAFMTDDAVFLSPGQSPCGREEFSTKFSAAHQQLAIHCVSELEEVAVVGDIAYTRSRDALSVSPRVSGETTHLAGDRLTIYRRHSGGHWLLARDAHTLTPVEKD